MDFDPAGRGASQAFRVENESEEQFAIQISMFSREMTVDGKETNKPADNDFIVYPAQILLKPKRSQIIRVKWVGNPKPDKELAYRILAEQLPVSLTKDSSPHAKITLMVRYLGSVYIVPKGAHSDVIIDTVLAAKDDSGKEALQLVFNNRGTSHTILRDLTLRLTSNGKNIDLGPGQLSGINGENILAGTKRGFLLPWPEDLPKGAVDASFDFRRHR